MTLRDFIHAAGRPLTRALLHPLWRRQSPVAWTYLQLYLLGKRLSEGRELSTLQSLIVPGMVIADIGANVGFYTFEMARCVGPTGRVLAFEPDPFSFHLLQRRLSQAPAGNVEQGKGELPAQVREHFFAVLFPQMHHHLGIGVAAQDVPVLD